MNRLYGQLTTYPWYRSAGNEWPLVCEVCRLLAQLSACGMLQTEKVGTIVAERNDNRQKGKLE
jgi:hypothetical protein